MPENIESVSLTFNKVSGEFQIDVHSTEERFLMVAAVCLAKYAILSGIDDKDAAFSRFDAFTKLVSGELHEKFKN